MSIPKEPRQLMINLMYLVLTAMLALNVSAEIINAFFALDKGIAKNNKIVDHASAEIIAGMDETAKTKKQYAPLVEKAKQAKDITKGFYSYIDDLRNVMVRESGGIYILDGTQGEWSSRPECDKYESHHYHITEKENMVGKPSGKKDKDTPQRIFVSGDYTGAVAPAEFETPAGPQLEQKIKDLKEEYLKFVGSLWDNDGIKGTIFADKKNREPSLAKLREEMTLASSEDYDPSAHENKSWAEYTFGHMPVAAIYPMLRKFQNDAKTSESAVINFLASQMGKLELNYDKFDVFAQASKGYILLGETYESEIALGAYSSQANFTVAVGGSRLSVQDGKAKYTAKPKTIGEKTYSAKISVNNPLTGETEAFTKEFKYEVGQPSVNVSADQMNVFYIGVKNPVTVAAAGVATSSMKVSMSNGTMAKTSGTGYDITCKSPGKAVVTVKDTKKNKSYPFEFRVKRIPDPVVLLANKTDGQIKSGTFRAQLGLIPKLKNFDFDATCKIQSYILYYTRKRQDPVELKGNGNRFTGKVSNAIKAAKAGDQYAFTSVRARCPGDKAARPVNGLSFIIR